MYPVTPDGLGEGLGKEETRASSTMWSPGYGLSVPQLSPEEVRLGPAACRLYMLMMSETPWVVQPALIWGMTSWLLYLGVSKLTWYV